MAVPRVKGETFKLSLPSKRAGAVGKRSLDVAARGQPSGGSWQSPLTHRVALGADRAGKGPLRKRSQPPSGAGETGPAGGSKPRRMLQTPSTHRPDRQQGA